MSEDLAPQVGADPEDPLTDYPRHEDGLDEMLGRDGAPRPHWALMAEGLQALGRRGIARRWAEARRLVRENGVTYNVYGDPRGMDRPWSLDAIPLPIPAAEWRGVADGLAQRAELLNLVLADCYGPQRLVREGLLPPELVLAHPNFLRPLHGVVPPERRWLHLYAADLGRGRDGRWWVLADRTQAPSGTGYALENRLALGRSFAELFRDCQVSRLAGFFAAFRTTLARLAPRPRETPRIVLLTPGPFNETWFEHAYLARYLGVTLAQGADLTVRDEAVFLKTLGGLEPVDVVLRRLDDDWCDPLALRGDSTLGVAGLVEAVRAGNVAVANALGTGLLESPALVPFLPRLCRHLLGEALTLPSVRTFWCATPDAMAYVETHLDELVLKPAHPGTGIEPVFGEELSTAARDALVRRIRSEPWAWVAQERFPLSTAPIWDGNRMQPRHIALRTFATATAAGWEAMPGGLTRVADSRSSLVVSMQRGGGSKDTWILTDGPVGSLTLLRPPGQPTPLTRSGGELPSRVADDLFWLGRYLERAEGLVRLLRALCHRLATESDPAITPALNALADAVGAVVQLPTALPHARHVDDVDALELAARALLHADEPQRALRPTLAAAQRLATLCRDQIPPDTWRVLGQLERSLHGHGPHGSVPALGETLDLLDHLVLTFAAFSGLGAENMTRGQGWRFTDIGRRIERAAVVVGLVQTLLVTPREEEGPVLEAVLDACDSVVTYRRRYVGAPVIGPVLDLLLADETNPRGVAWQLAALEAHLQHLPHAGDAPFRTEEERIVLASLTRVRLVDPGALSRVAASGRREDLGALGDRLAQALPDLSDALSRRYLSHTMPSRRVTTL